jgi:C4-dicarboxylate-binding protein DctP
MRIRKRRLAGRAGIIGAILALAVSGAPAADTVVMKFGINNPIKEFNQAWTSHLVLKNEIEARSSGRIKVELYPGSQLGSIESMVNQVRRGTIQATDPADGHFATTYPLIQILSIPYLFPSREVAWKVLDGPFGQKLADDMAKKIGMRPLFWQENGGFRHFTNSKRAIRSPEDMKGLKIRTMNIPLHMKIVEDLGGSATPINWSEVYTSLQTGVADGQENAIPTFLLPKLEEVQKYMVLDGHVYGVMTVVVNEKWYQDLPADLKQAIQGAIPVVLATNRGLSVANEAQGVEYLQKRGVEIYAPTPEQHKKFREATQASAVKWLKSNVDPAWVDDLLAAVAKAERER